MKLVKVNEPRSLGSWCTREFINLGKDSLYHDLNDLCSLILLPIIKNTHTGANLGVTAILVIWDIFLFVAIEKLIQARGEASPVLTSFDPIHSPTAKEPPDQLLPNVVSYSPIHSGTNSATSTPSSSTKRSTRRRTMLFSSSVCTVSKEYYSQHLNSHISPHTLCLVHNGRICFAIIVDTK